MQNPSAGNDDRSRDLSSACYAVQVYERQAGSLHPVRTLVAADFSTAIAEAARAALRSDGAGVFHVLYGRGGDIALMTSLKQFGDVPDGSLPT